MFDKLRLVGVSGYYYILFWEIQVFGVDPQTPNTLRTTLVPLIIQFFNVLGFVCKIMRGNRKTILRSQNVSGVPKI